MAKAVTPRNQERPFDIEELFFSTTDKKGIIQSGNDVFVRVSGYSIENLIGKPHNIIRHPDVPRAVFKLLWDYLNDGKTFAGYVKNMAADGSFYWVMALVVPLQDGYLSVRFKPGTEYLSVVKQLYADMLRVERESGNSQSGREAMQKSCELLMAALKEKGFDSYDDFIHTVMPAELACRRAKINEKLAKASGTSSLKSAGCDLDEEDDDLRKGLRAFQQINRQLDDLFTRVDSYLQLIKVLNAKSSFLLTFSNGVHLISLNGLIASYRLGDAGGGLAVVTHNLAKILEEGTIIIKDITGLILMLTTSLRKTGFFITSAKLQIEMAIFFMNEVINSNKGADRSRTLLCISNDIKALIDSFLRSTEQMLELVPVVQSPISSLIRQQDGLAFALRKLPSVQVTGKVAAAYTSQEINFRELFKSISTQTEEAERELEELSNGISFLKMNIPSIERGGNSIQNALLSFKARAALA